MGDESSLSEPSPVNLPEFQHVSTCSTIPATWWDMLVTLHMEGAPFPAVWILVRWSYLRDWFDFSFPTKFLFLCYGVAWHTSRVVLKRCIFDAWSNQMVVALELGAAACGLIGMQPVQMHPRMDLNQGSMMAAAGGSLIREISLKVPSVFGPRKNPGFHGFGWWRNLYF